MWRVWRTEGTLPASLEDMMLLAARSESVKVVFPWSTCPQVVIFRVVSEFDPIERKEKESSGCICPPATSASSIPTTFTTAFSTATARDGDDDCPTV